MDPHCRPVVLFVVRSVRLQQHDNQVHGEKASYIHHFFFFFECRRLTNNKVHSPILNIQNKKARMHENKAHKSDLMSNTQRIKSNKIKKKDRLSIYYSMSLGFWALHS